MASLAAAQAPTAAHGFEPYANNGGTAMAIAGKDFCVVAADTRMSVGYSISSRNVTKLHRLTDRCVLGSSGMQADMLALRKHLDGKSEQYEQRHGRQMTTESFSQLLSNTLYSRRFFPYYTFNVLAGLDEEGRGAVYTYDAVGSFERAMHGVKGTGSALITSLLDNQVDFLTQPQNKRELSLEETVALVKDSFTVCAERDIHTGDKVEILVLTRDGVREEIFQLRKD